MYTILPKFGFAHKLNPNGYSDYVCVGLLLAMLSTIILQDLFDSVGRGYAPVPVCQKSNAHSNNA